MGFLSAISNLPGSDDGAALGSATLEWSDLFLASGGVINWANGNITLTHATGTLTLAGGQLVIPLGSASLPSLTFPGTAVMGLYSVNADGIYFSQDGAAYALLSRANTVPAFALRSDFILSWSSTTSNLKTENTMLGQDGTNGATLRMGLNAAAPVTQTFKGPDARAGTDTNTVGGRMNWRTGLSTGTGVPALGVLQGGAASVTSGTTAHTVVDRFIPNAFRVLTNNSAIGVVDATIANGSSVGGLITYTIEVWDGTDNQVETGQAVYSSKNKAGTVTGTITEINSQQNLDSGTLATTWAISAANPAVISINANSSLTPSTGYPRITYSVQNLGQQAVAI